MKRRFYLVAASLVAGSLCSVQSATAIEIVVPDQYKAQIEAAKAAERAERARELDEGQQSAETQGDTRDTEIADQTKPEAPADDDAAGSQDFVMQSVVEAEDAAAAFEGTLGEDEGLVSGQVLDEESGAPVSGAAILIEGTDVATVTGADGRYSLGPIPAGEYTLSFVKSGYLEANVTDYQIAGGEVSVFPFALPPRPAEMSDEVYELQDFTVTAEQANEMMMNLELRMDADSIMDVLGAEDLSRFADSDVASAVKRVAGVSVQDGKFAVIRGLDERYSSSLLNGVPIPSPDPERQSVPLDLFPSEVVQNLVVSKTFSPSDPSNSAGGSINIVTNVFPEEFTVKGSAGFGINENARERFLEPSQSRLGIDFDDVLNLRAVDVQGFGGVPVERDSDDVIDHSFDVQVGDTTEIFGKTFKYLSSVAFDKSYESRFGTEQKRKARPQDVEDGQIRDMTFTDALWDVTESQSEEQLTFLLATELFLDEAENHALGYTLFHTEVDQGFAAFRENGRFPGIPVDGETRIETDARIGDTTPLGNEFPGAVRGIITIANDSFFTTNEEILDFYEQFRLVDLLVMEQERELTTHQLKGSHEFLEGGDDELSLSWAGSYSKTFQEDLDVFRVGAVDIPEQFGGGFITGRVAGGFGGFEPDRSWRRIEEEQKYFRTDGRYSRVISDWLEIETRLGVFKDETERESSQFYTGVDLKPLDRFNSDPAQPSPDLEDGIGGNIGTNPNNQFEPAALAESTRESEGFYFSTKANFREKWELILGARVEQLLMTTQTETGSADSEFFNSGILMDNDNDPTNSSTPASAVANTKLLGINGGLPLPPGFQGEIEEDMLFLPALTLIYRPDDATRLTAAYSQTNVRPSFKEFTFLTVRNPVSLDLESGNPTLTTSHVESFDLRIDRTFNDRGDRASIALFYKTVSDPIERTNLSNTDIFFNNPNEATIQGIEFEFRKFLGGFGPSWLEYFSIGGNFAWIEASVGIPETFREELIDDFGVENPDSERRLFAQPEWLANADISFDHPDWGTRATLSLFAQSDVLDTAGGFDGSNASVDTFRKPFQELNFTLSQRINDIFSIKFTAKNITDSERGLEYREPGGDERSFRVGRDYSISVSASF